MKFFHFLFKVLDALKVLKVFKKSVIKEGGNHCILNI